jgi:hypothetical protein
MVFDAGVNGACPEKGLETGGIPRQQLGKPVVGFWQAMVVS